MPGQGSIVNIYWGGKDPVARQADTDRLVHRTCTEQYRTEPASTLSNIRENEVFRVS